MKTTILLLIAPVFSFIGQQKIERNSRSKSNETSIVEISATPPGISITNTRIVEGHAGLREAEVLVSISERTSVSITVDYSTKNGTAIADSDYLAAKGSITFAPGERVKRIKVSIIGEVLCEDDEKFEIAMSNVSGATLDRNSGTVTILNDDCGGNNVSGPFGNFSKNLSIYEVRFTHTGYATYITGPEECEIRPKGKVVLTGLVAGMENVHEHDDINYIGNLQMNIDIDICSTRPTGGDPPDVLCGMTVIGSGTVEVDLDIYFDQRGGYIKFEHKSGPFYKKIFGTCQEIQIREEEAMVPNQSIASMFNGMALLMLTNRTLRVGRYVESDGVVETVVEVLRVIRQ